MNLYSGLCFFFLLIGSYLDIRFKKIPNTFWFFPCISFLLIYPSVSFPDVFAIFLFVLFPLLLLRFLLGLLKKKKFIGGADFKLLFYLSFLFSFSDFLSLLIFSLIPACFYAILQKEKGMNEIPLIPFLSAGAILAYLLI